MSEMPLNPRAAAAVLMDECDNDMDRAKRLARTRLMEPRFDELRTLLWQSMIDLAIDEVWRSGRDIRKREADRGPSFVSSPVERPPLVRVEKAGGQLYGDTQRLVASHSSPAPLKKGETSTPNPAMMGAVRRVVAGLMQAEMPGGTKLEDWTKRDIIEHGRRVKANAQGALRWSFFLLSVGNMLSKDATKVGDELVEADLQRLWRQQAQLPA